MGHIRPKVRKPAGIPEDSKGTSERIAATVGDENDDKITEDARAKLERWTGVGKNPDIHSASEKSSGIPSQVVVTQEPCMASIPKSILRTPKYSSTSENVQHPSLPMESVSTQKGSSVFKDEKISESVNVHLGSGTGPNSGPKGSAGAIEGYVPSFDHNKRISDAKEKNEPERDRKQENRDDDNADVLIFNSLADMMQAAGTLPRQGSTEAAQMVEAKLSFSCLSPEEYQQQVLLQGMSELEAEEEEEENSGKPEPREWKAADETDQGRYTGSSHLIDSEEDDVLDDKNDKNGGGNGLLDLLGDGDSEDESEHEDFRPRAFRIIWECLLPLITHESVTFVRQLQKHLEGDEGVGYLMTSTPTDELIASRSAGFLAMLRMHLSRSLKELGQPLDMQHTAEQRLLSLSNTFNFSRPTGKLETPQWRALTCVLLEVVLFLDRDYGGEDLQKLPASVRNIGMSVEEYHYLARNFFHTFGSPDDPVLELHN